MKIDFLGVAYDKFGNRLQKVSDGSFLPSTKYVDSFGKTIATRDFKGNWTDHTGWPLEATSDGEVPFRTLHITPKRLY